MGSHYFQIELPNLVFQHCHYIGRPGRAKINTETHVIRSTVVKKDTACRKQYGSSRAEISVESIMRRSTIVNKDKTEPIMSHSTVVKTDTASRKRCGSSRAKINPE